MKTRRVKGNDRENTGELPVFTTADGITYIRCYYCGDPITTSNVYCWQEDKDGKSYNLSFVHYPCQQPFEKMYNGKWWQRHAICKNRVVNGQSNKARWERVSQLALFRKGVDDS
jgi:hypothetical protein